MDKVHNQPEVIKKAKTMVQPVESGAGLLVCLNNVRWWKCSVKSFENQFDNASCVEINLLTF